MISELFCVTGRGETIFYKKYRHDIKDGTTEVFCKRIRETRSTPLLPSQVKDDIYYHQIKRGQVYFVATTVSPVSAILVIEQLSRLYHLCKDFCGVITEDSLRANIILIYEFLDEFMDGGYTQLSSTDKLKAYIQSDPLIIKPRTPDNMTPGLFGMEFRQVQNTASDKPVVRPRQEQEMRKNEVFVDVIERISSLTDASGNILRSEINGRVNMKCFLPSTSTIRLGLNEDLIIGAKQGYGNHPHISNCSFHDSVRVDSFDEKKVMFIIPPQGEFAAMTYSQQDELSGCQPLRLMYYIKESDSSKDTELVLRVRCDIPSRCHIVKILVKVPLPKSATGISQQLTTSGQTATFSAKDKSLVWNIKKLVGGSETSATFKIIVSNPTAGMRQELGPVAMEFEVSGYVCSGLLVRFLQVYDRDKAIVPHQWVRYITVPDSYIFRLT